MWTVENLFLDTVKCTLPFIKGYVNIAFINYKERNTLSKILYKHDPSNARFKNGLTINYIKLGNIAIKKK